MVVDNAPDRPSLPASPSAAKTAGPNDEQPVRTGILRTSTDKATDKAAGAAPHLQAPVVDIPVPVPPAPVKLKPLEIGRNDQRTGGAVAKNAPAEAIPEQAPRADVALQVRIRLQPEQMPAPVISDAATAPTEPRPLRAVTGQTKTRETVPNAAEPDAAESDAAEKDTGDPTQPPALDASAIESPEIKASATTHPRSSEPSSNAEPVPPMMTAAHSANPTLTTAAEPTNLQPEASAPPTPSQAAPANPAQLPEPAPEPKASQQPLQSISLEFAPDGASDVRLRLSERAGEVHISLHSSDPSLSGRLHEGVHDLVGSLANAGYDAEAWTPSQGRQNNQRQPDTPPRVRRSGSSGAGAEDFGGMLQQPIQEIS